MPRKKVPEKEKLAEERDEKIGEAVADAAEGADSDTAPGAAPEGMTGERILSDRECDEDGASAVVGSAGTTAGEVPMEEGHAAGLGSAWDAPTEGDGDMTASEGPVAVTAEDGSDAQEPAALEFHLVSDAGGEDSAPLDGTVDPEGDAPLPGSRDTEENGPSGAGEGTGGGALHDGTDHEEDAPQTEGNALAGDMEPADTGGDGGEPALEAPDGGVEAVAGDDDPPAGPGEDDPIGSEEGDSVEGVPAPKRKQAKKADGDTAVKKEPVKHKAAAADRTPMVAQPKVSLRSQNVRALDRDLTPEEKKEWDAIYASYTSKSILTGVVQGVDMNTFTIRNAEGLLETKKMASAVIISHRVKVLIPELEFSMPDKLLPESVVHHLDQCSVDYVIISVDRENNLAIASRRLAMSARRRYFRTALRGHERGEELTCRVISVGPTRCTVECNGYDQEMRASDMSYNYIEDLREVFRPGDELRCRLVDYNAKDGLKVSVKEAQRHPFDGAVERHPIGCTRHATITNKDSGAIFCLLSDDVTCVCRYASQLNDADFEIGDTVVIVVDSYYLEGKMIRGKILKKW